MTRKQLMKKAIVSGVFSLLVLAIVVASTVGWFISAGSSRVGQVSGEIEANVFSAQVTFQGEKGSHTVTLTSDESIGINQDSFYLTDYVYDTNLGEKIYSWAPGYSGFTLLSVENNGTAPIRLKVTLEDITFKTTDTNYISNLTNYFGFDGNEAEYIECYKNLSAAGVTFPVVFYDSNSNGVIDGGEVFTDANSNGQFDEGETYSDANSNGMFDSGEVYFDASGNKLYATFSNFSILRSQYNTAVDNLRSAVNFNETSWKTSWRSTNRVFSKYFVENSIPGEGNISLYSADNTSATPVGSSYEIIDADLLADMRVEPGKCSGAVPITFWWPFDVGSTGWSYDQMDDDFLKGMMETYTDANANGNYDEGETFTDLNGNGKFDGNVGELVFTVKVSMQQVAPS